MPQTSFPRDRFDDLPEDGGRVGAHRAEQPHLHGWTLFFWAVAATVVLTLVGVFATMIASGRIQLVPEPEPTVAATPVEAVEPVVDTSYQVLILNATPQEGLATQTRDVVLGAGWAASDVTAGEAGSQDFAETTVYYLSDEDEAAALGLADVIGGARTEQSDVYQVAVEGASQLTVVLGLDRIEDSASATPEP
ncbi:LytR C-terminal domain-containing protein [Microbacter sp. GSS18]|nr:LytR C-terminal domain-containing protein [Microbacter sp. GSS18]